MCNLCLKAGMSRRLLMGAGLATAATLSFANKSAQAQPARLAETPDAALKLLVEASVVLGDLSFLLGLTNPRVLASRRHSPSTRSRAISSWCAWPVIS